MLASLELRVCLHVIAACWASKPLGIRPATALGIVDACCSKGDRGTFFCAIGGNTMDLWVAEIRVGAITIYDKGVGLVNTI